MSISILPYGDHEAEKWDNFVDASRNGTLFHTRRFLQYHPADRFEDASLLFFEEGVLRAVLPGAVRHIDGKRHYVSHPGSTFGGIVLSSGGGSAAAVGCIDAAVKYFREQGYASARFLRLTPPSLRQQPADDQEYALLQSGFRLTSFELGSMIFLGEEKSDLLATLDISCRNKVRQGIRAGIEVRFSEGMEEFWPILGETLQKRHGVHPTHTLEEMQKLMALCPDEIRFYGAFLKGKVIAGLLLMTVSRGTEYVKYMVQDFAHHKVRPINVLLLHVMEESRKRGVRVIDLGVSMDTEGKHIHPGLFDFKEGFGGMPVRRETYELSL